MNPRQHYLNQSFQGPIVAETRTVVTESTHLAQPQINPAKYLLQHGLMPGGVSDSNSVTSYSGKQTMGEVHTNSNEISTYSASYAYSSPGNNGNTNLPANIRSANQMILQGRTPLMSFNPTPQHFPPLPSKPHSATTQAKQIYTPTIQTYRPLTLNQYQIPQPHLTPLPPVLPQPSGCCGMCSFQNCFLCGCCPCVSIPDPHSFTSATFAPGPVMGASGQTADPNIEYKEYSVSVGRGEGCFCPQCGQGVGCCACCQTQVCCIPCCDCL